MNEVGVDPGIDHLLAVECFDEIREHGAKVLIVPHLKGVVLNLLCIGDCWNIISIVVMSR